MKTIEIEMYVALGMTKKTETVTVEVEDNATEEEVEKECYANVELWIWNHIEYGYKPL